MSGFLAVFLRGLVVALWMVVLGRVLLSWIDPDFRSPLGRFLYGITEPMLAPIRRVLPRTGSLDLSPLVLLVGISLMARVVLAL